MNSPNVLVAGAAVGAILVLSGLFAFQILAAKLFVTRAEWEVFQRALDTRLAGMQVEIKDALKMILDDIRASRTERK